MKGEYDTIDDDESLGKNRACNLTKIQTFLIVFGCVAGLLLAFLLGIVVSSTIQGQCTISDIPIPCSPPRNGPTHPKNIIFFVADGLGPAGVTLIRTLKKLGGQGDRLIVDDLMLGTVKTPSYDSLVTDSAAAASAMATGEKVISYSVSVFPETQKAAGTVMEAAKLQGMSTGLITTSYICDATPAAFSAHSLKRDFRQFIALQQINQSVDVMLGGGKTRCFSPAGLEYATTKYNTIYHKAQLPAAQLPLLGLFADNDLQSELDRLPTSQEPTLLEMTQRGIELLVEQDNDKGFFLLVEQERTDTAAHFWDFYDVVKSGEMIEDTLQYILDFVKQKNDTLLIITSDHETAGLTLGRGANVMAFYPGNLTKQLKSAEYLGQHLYKVNDTVTLTRVLLEETGVDPTPEEINTLVELQSGDEDDFIRGIGSIIAKKAYLGATTTEHTGVDVNFYGYGPQIQNFCGNFDNTDIAKKLSKIFGWDLEQITESLKDFNATGYPDL